MDTKFGDFVLHWTIAALKFFKENLLTNFGLIAVFSKIVLESPKKAQHCVWLIHVFSCSFEISQGYLRLARCRVSKGHLQNEWVIKLFGRIQNVANLSALSPAFSSCISYTLFVEIQRYLEFLFIDFCETLHNGRQAPKVYVVLSISKEKCL